MKIRMNGFVRVATMLSVAVALTACKAEKKESEAHEGAKEAGEATSGSAKPTGDTVKIEIYSDAVGNYYKPNEIEAKRGDVLRFTLKSGVHNIHFLPDSNTIKTGLPPASDLLQLPDQTYDLPVNFAEGKYYFQCDPHAALGMKGHLKVEDK